jgi:hypothetical protein
MIYTSYFANWRKFPEGFKTLSIALYPPPRFGSVIVELMPTLSLLSRAKAKEISEAEYILEYNEQLANLSPHKIAQRCESSILLCYEKSKDFCHRHLVRAWFNAHKIECEEL